MKQYSIAPFPVERHLVGALCYGEIKWWMYGADSVEKRFQTSIMRTVSWIG